MAKFGENDTRCRVLPISSFLLLQLLLLLQLQCTNGQQLCNGFESLCDTAVNATVFATVHNAVSTTEDGVPFFANHRFSLEAALEAGFRGINVDIGKCSENDVKLIHGACSFSQRDPIEVFSNIATFLNANPNEVIIMPLEIVNNAEGGPVTLDEIAAIIAQVPEFEQLLYAHPGPSTAWPTLRQLIAANTRILLFHYNGQTCADYIASSNSADGGKQLECPFGFHDWFAMYGAETQYQFDSVDAFKNRDYACEITRGSSTADFIGMNLFTTIPSSGNCDQLNAQEFLDSFIPDCSNLYNYSPNLLIVDCWDRGDVQLVVSQLNNGGGGIIPVIPLDPTTTTTTTTLTTSMVPTTSATKTTTSSTTATPSISIIDDDSRDGDDSPPTLSPTLNDTIVSTSIPTQSPVAKTTDTTTTSAAASASVVSIPVFSHAGPLWVSVLVLLSATLVMLS